MENLARQQKEKSCKLIVKTELGRGKHVRLNACAMFLHYDWYNPNTTFAAVTVNECIPWGQSLMYVVHRYSFGEYRLSPWNQSWWLHYRCKAQFEPRAPDHENSS